MTSSGEVDAIDTYIYYCMWICLAEKFAIKP